jgi:hypothetical protein
LSRRRVLATPAAPTEQFTFSAHPSERSPWQILPFCFEDDPSLRRVTEFTLEDAGYLSGHDHAGYQHAGDDGGGDQVS